MKPANYEEFNELPVWTQAVWKNDKVVNDADPFKWSGDKDPPAIGTVVKTYLNGLGTGTVLRYFVEYGWLGLIVAFENPPKWYVKQNNGNPPGHIFGVDLKRRNINPQKETAS